MLYINENSYKFTSSNLQNYYYFTLTELKLNNIVHLKVYKLNAFIVHFKSKCLTKISHK